MPLNMGARRAINFRGRQVLDVGRFYRGAPRTQGSPSSDTTLSREPDSEPADQSDDLTRSLVRLINLPTYPLDRLSRYEATLWRTGQILFTLQCLHGEVIEATEELTGCGTERSYVDKGYRGHKNDKSAPRLHLRPEARRVRGDQTRAPLSLRYRARDRTHEKWPMLPQRPRR